MRASTPLTVLASLLLLACPRPRSAAPTPEELRARFNADSAMYAGLVTMLWQDSLVGTVGEDFLFRDDHPFEDVPVPSLGISKERLRLYRARMDSLGVRRLDRSGRSAVTFLLWGSGFGGNTHHRGIAWLDSLPPGRLDRSFVAIRDHWYSFGD